MRWELLSSPEFKKAVAETGVCVLPIGVLERHGDHAPLGTDFLIAHQVAINAAELESAVVFPPYFFGQINEARCFPGAVALEPALILQLVGNIIDEIGRNGFKKIILLNCHGGNWNMLEYFIQYQIYKQKDYTVYLFKDSFPVDGTKNISDEVKKIVSKYPCHAGEWETSLMMGVNPDSVNLSDVPKEPGLPLGRLSHLKWTGTVVNWYADYPNHYDGDATTATKEKGDKLLQLHSRHFSQYIKAVKDDETAPALQKEFFEKAEQV